MRQELNTHPLELSQEVSDKTYFIMKKVTHGITELLTSGKIIWREMEHIG